MVKIFSFFTKTGKIEVPIKDTDTVKATSIAKNPIMDLADKLREINDLSSKLTKAQVAETLAKGIEKVEFTDVDGSKQTLLKGGPGSGRKPEGGINQEHTELARTLFPHSDEMRGHYIQARQAGYNDIEARKHTATAFPKSKGAEFFGTQKVEKGGPGSGRHPEGGTLSEQVDSKFKEGIQQAQESRDSEAERYSPKDSKNTWEAKTPKNPEVKPEGADNKKIATEHIKLSVPLKHQEAAKAYVNSDSFKQDVARHDSDRQRELTNLGYARGGHPAVRALNEHMHSTMSKAEWADFEKVVQDDMEKVGWTDEAREAAAEARQKGNGGNRINSENVGGLVDRKEPFATSNGQMYGKNEPNGNYAVHSYGRHFPMYVHDGSNWHGNSDKFSSTTSKQMNQAKPTGAIKYHNTEDIKNIRDSFYNRPATKKNIDDLRNIAGKITKGGPGSGCTGSNCGRPSTGGTHVGVTPINPTANTGRDENKISYEERLRTTKNPNNPFYEKPSLQSVSDAVDRVNAKEGPDAEVNKKPYVGKKYNFHSDPGHGWLAVPKSDLKDLGIHDKITGYSYMKGNTAYLEEDSDATTFHDAMKQKTGNKDLKFTDYINEKNSSNNQSPIRNYQSYDHTK